jgi:alcohol dehydrogenase
MSFKNNSNASNPRDLGQADYGNILEAALGA